MRHVPLLISQFRSDFTINHPPLATLNDELDSLTLPKDCVEALCCLLMRIYFLHTGDI